MRTITDHKVNGLNEALEVTALDAAGPGGANHRYAIDLSPENPAKLGKRWYLDFQNGPIQSPADFNGITNEALLAVVIDRMRGFQHGRKPSPVASEHDDGFDFATRGQFACRENACALTHLEEALMWLQKRTRDRMARDVEGRNVP